MAPIILPILQGLFLVLLYLFVWRIARAILRDLRAASQAQRQGRPAPAARQAAQAPPRQAPQQRRAQARELVIHLADGPPRVLPLNGSEVTFGRAAPATVVLDDPYVSDRHARITHEHSIGWVVTDLGSTNGTFLNQVKVTRPTPITPGDQLGIGKTTVEVRR